MEWLAYSVRDDCRCNTKRSGGALKHGESRFRNWITADRFRGFPAGAGRHYFCVSLACTWGHRSPTFLALKGRGAEIDVSVGPLDGGAGLDLPR